MSYARFGSPMQDFETTEDWLAWNAAKRAAIDALEDSSGWGDKVPEEFRGSDVYVYFDVGGYLCCCGCSLGDEWNFHSTDEMLAHLDLHIKAGHRVPPSCLRRLEDEREENDAELGVTATRATNEQGNATGTHGAKPPKPNPAATQSTPKGSES